MGVMHPCTYPGCIKTFDRKYNLKCHLRIHSNEKPYRCHHQNCTRSFRWKSSLNHHLMSLDHTPPAVRRARKASAQRRRLHNSSSQTFIPHHQIDHHPVFDLPTHSPVSSTPTYSHSPSPQPPSVSHIPHPSPHNFKLDQPFPPPHIPNSSISTTPLTVPQELHFINNTHVSQTSPDQSVPTIPSPQQTLHSHTQPYKLSNPVLRTAQPPQPQPQPQPHHDPTLRISQHSIIAQLQDPLVMPVKHLHNSLIHDTPIKQDLRTFIDHSSPPTSTSEADTTLHIPHDDTISFVTPTKKNEPLELTSSNKMPPADPLVSISFEDFSPVSLMPFPSSLDTLFPANVDPSAMKTF